MLHCVDRGSEQLGVMADMMRILEIADAWFDIIGAETRLRIATAVPGCC
jgi:hypothetical protein